jgi:hypothetical protein
MDQETKPVARKRIDVPFDVYDALERQAAHLHIPVNALANLYLRESCERSAETPLRSLAGLRAAAVRR